MASGGSLSGSLLLLLLLRLLLASLQTGPVSSEENVCSVPAAAAAGRPQSLPCITETKSTSSNSTSQPVPPGVQLVHFHLVHQPVKVLCEQFSLAQLGELLPCSSGLLQDLPPGLGLRGGVSRNLLRVLEGHVAEPDYQDCSKMDVDVLALVPPDTPASTAARELALSLELGGRQLRAGDVEVLGLPELPSYFIMRDISMNEVLLLKMSHNRAMLCYSEQAQLDVKRRIARPAVHSLQQQFHMAWELGADGVPRVAFPLLRRCLVRLLKGHAASYALDEGTWWHYRHHKLQLHELFQLMRPFQGQGPGALSAVVQHLLSSGFLDGRLLLAAGSVERLWELALQEASGAFGTVAVHERRLVRAASDLDNVSLWELWGQQQVAQQMRRYYENCQQTGCLPADESVASLGLLQLPQELLDYATHGPSFNVSMTFSS